jgi:spore coat protein CotH
MALLCLLLLLASCSDNAKANADAGPDAGTDSDVDCDDLASEFDFVFPQDRVVEIQIDFEDPTAYDQMIAAANVDTNDTPFFAADFSFDGETMTNVGVRLKGNSSLGSSADHQQKSFKIHFEEYVNGQRFHCVDRLSLNNNFKDPSIMRERLAYALAEAMGLEAPRTTYALVWIDGELHGVRTMVQQVDTRFLREHFGEDDGADDGNLYKCYTLCNLRYIDDDPASYTTDVPGPPCDDPTGEECGLKLKTNEDDPALNDYTDVIGLIRTVDQVLNGQAGTEELEAVFDVEQYARFQAWSLALANLDSYFSSTRNFYLYNRPTDGRFQFIPWDLNEAYGCYGCMGPDMDQYDVLEVDLLTPCWTEGDPPGPGSQEPKPLMRLIIEQPAYAALYCDALDQLLGALYTVADQDEQIAALHAVVDEARQQTPVLSQPPGDFTYDDYLTAISHDPGGIDQMGGTANNLGYFNDERIANVVQQMEEVCP